MKVEPLNERLPAGIRNAYGFQASNAISFCLVNGPLMVLYFKHLGASATILGILAAIPPVLFCLQVPAAHYIEKVGYRAFVLKGWSLRSLSIMLMPVVIFLPDRVGSGIKIALMFILLIFYYALRGISSSGYLPWISRLVPEKLLGRYLSMEQISGGLAAVVMFLLVGWFLGKVTDVRAIGVVFFGSFVAATFSLFYLRRMPDVQVTPETRTDAKLSWREIIFYPSFFRFLKYSVVISTATGVASAFWAPYMRDTFHATDSHIMLIVAGNFFMHVGFLFLFGKRIDRVGCRPVLALSGISLMMNFMGWGLIGAGVFPYTLGTLAFQCCTAGLGNSLSNLANMRLLMATAPERSRSHFFAYFSVTNNIVLGIVPVFWGMILDHLHGWNHTLGAWHFNSYSILYLAMTLTIACGLIFLKKVNDSNAMPTHVFLHELMILGPRKIFSQIFSRRPNEI